MSCCTVKKQTNSSIKEFDILKSKFDDVVLEDLEKYRLLTLRNKANKSNMDWIVWLQVKVPYGTDKTRHSKRTDEEMLTGLCKSISDWVDILIGFEKSNAGKQLSLFGDESDDELEKEPSSPTYGEEKSWDKYFRECNRVRKNNLMKKYSFFELCDLTNAWYTYHEIDYKHLLPQSDKEMIELVKEAIIKGTSSDEGHGRFDDFWWDDSYDYITRNGALSNIELIDRVKSLIRLHLVPYTREFHVNTDLSYSLWEFEKKTDYRYWFDGRKIIGNSWNDNKNLPSYELYDLEFIDWLRNHFNISYKEVISDDDILRENLECYMWRLIGSENAKVFDFKNKINTFKDWKQLKASITSLIPRGNNGGGSGHSIDGFRGGYSIDGKGNIKITQNYEQRIKLNRSVDGLERDDYRDSDVLVFNISGDEIYKKAFELFSKKTVIQTSLFDFLTAA